jgi:hypothetical protein
MASTRIAMRRYLIAKVALWLQQDSRDMSAYSTLERTSNVITVLFGNTRYAIVPRVDGQELFIPGVNITFLDEADASPERNKNKRFIQPVIIRISRPIDAGHNIYALEEEALTVVDKVQECFSDGRLEIWDYTDLDNPTYMENVARWDESGIPASNESFAVAGGDITYSINIFLEYVNFSYG